MAFRSFRSVFNRSNANLSASLPSSPSETRSESSTTEIVHCDLDSSPKSMSSLDHRHDNQRQQQQQQQRRPHHHHHHHFHHFLHFRRHSQEETTEDNASVQQADCNSNMSLDRSSSLLNSEGYRPPAKNCHRMVILGSSRVGKTCIVSRFLNNKYDDKYTPTIEDFHRKLYRIRGEVYQLDILDTSGNHPFPAMRRLSFLTGELSSVHVICSSRTLNLKGSGAGERFGPGPF